MRNISELLYFLNDTMSMSEVYQPAIILYLLESGGSASKEELATMLSGYDESVQEYYQKILMRWPRKTLTKHDVIRYNKKRRTFRLNFSLNEPELIERAKNICEAKIEEWIEKRLEEGNSSYVEASKRYKVLKAARGKCELCGISSKITPIDIDHIVPKSQADKVGFIVKDGQRMHLNDERNLQALCFRCNRAKRDVDDTDFRLPSAKLVRDRIPEIISESGRRPTFRKISGVQLKEQLIEKLTEEHAELLDSVNLEEIADMMEILISLAKQLGYSEKETITFLHKKRKEKGGFSLGIFLERIEKSTDL